MNQLKILNYDPAFDSHQVIASNFMATDSSLTVLGKLLQI